LGNEKLTFSIGFCLVGAIFLFTRLPESLETMSSVEQKDKNDNPGGFQFEVKGKVQNVSFRKYTQRQAREIGGIVGWIRNTDRETVEGEVASRLLEKRERMQEWLRTTGSPRSEIESASFIDMSMDDVERLLHTKSDFEIEKRRK
jgi:acylphosphatase